MKDYPWYTVANSDEPLNQGDLLDSCPIIEPPSDMKLGPASVKAVEYDVAVMSQSCDLVQNNLDLVLVCPLHSFQEIAEKNENYGAAKYKEQLRRGNLPGYHLLDRCELDGFSRDFLVVDFRNVYSIHVQRLRKLAEMQGKRLRLLPPYREHLSQAFARFFMRVGLPVDIPAFK